MKLIQSTLFLAALNALAPLSQASVIITGNFNTGIPTPTLNLTSDVNVNIFNSGVVEFLAFDEWVISDSGITAALTVGAQNISYQLNAGPIITVPLNFVLDNTTFALGILTPNDGYLRFGPIPVTAGDVLTFKPGSFTFQPTVGFNPGLPASFTGTVFATGNQGGPLGEGTIIPEPSSALLLGVAVPALLRRRKRA